jgi:hypothetical protein
LQKACDNLNATLASNTMPRPATQSITGKRDEIVRTLTDMKSAKAAVAAVAAVDVSKAKKPKAKAIQAPQAPSGKKEDGARKKAVVGLNAGSIALALGSVSGGGGSRPKTEPVLRGHDLKISADKFKKINAKKLVKLLHMQLSDRANLIGKMPVGARKKWLEGLQKTGSSFQKHLVTACAEHGRMDLLLQAEKELDQVLERISSAAPAVGSGEDPVQAGVDRKRQLIVQETIKFKSGFGAIPLDALVSLYVEDNPIDMASLSTVESVGSFFSYMNGLGGGEFQDAFVSMCHEMGQDHVLASAKAQLNSILFVQQDFDSSNPFAGEKMSADAIVKIEAKIAVIDGHYTPPQASAMPSLGGSSSV